MSLTRRITRGTGLQLAARLFAACATFLVSALLLARLLDAAEFGRFSFYLTLFLLSMALADFGVNRAAVRLGAAGRLPMAVLLRELLAFKTLLGAAVFLLLAAIALLGEESAADRLVLVLAAAHALSHGLGSGSVPFEIAVDYRAPALAMVLGHALFLLVSLALAAAGARSAPPYLLGFGAGLVLQNAVLFALAARRHGVARRGDPATRAQLRAEALPLGISAVAVSIYFHVDTVLLRPLAGSEEVARYSVGYRLMAVGLLLPALFGQVLLPVLSRVAPAQLGRVVERAVYLMAAFGGAAAATLFVLAPELLAFLFGEPYRAAAAPLRLLAPALFAIFLCYPQTTALIAAGRAATFTRITLAAAALNLLLDVALIVPLRAEGAALATLFTELLVLFLGAALLRRATGATGFSRRTPRALLPAGLVLAGLLPLRHASPLVTLPLALLLTLAGARAAGALPVRLGLDEDEKAVR